MDLQTISLILDRQMQPTWEGLVVAIFSFSPISGPIHPEFLLNPQHIIAQRKQ